MKGRECRRKSVETLATAEPPPKPTAGCKTCGGPLEYGGWYAENLCQQCSELESMCPCLDRMAVEPVILPSIAVPALYFLARLQRLVRLARQVEATLNGAGYKLLYHAIFSTYQDIRRLDDPEALEVARRLVDEQAR